MPLDLGWVVTQQTHAKRKLSQLRLVFKTPRIVAHCKLQTISVSLGDFSPFWKPQAHSSHERGSSGTSENRQECCLPVRSCPPHPLLLLSPSEPLECFLILLEVIYSFTEA